MTPACKAWEGTWTSLLQAGPPGGGTHEGAYDNTAGTVSMMLYARVLAELEVECDTFLALLVV